MHKQLTIRTFVYCISDWICGTICAWITWVLDIGVIIIYGITTGWVDCENTTNSKTSCTWTFAWTSIGRAFTKTKCVRIKEMKILLYFRPSTYLEVKQVPFLYDVDPLLSWLVLTHGSFLKLTIVNREKTWTKNYLFNFYFRNDNKVCKTVYIILTFAFPISFVRNFCRFVLSCQTLETT